LHLNRIANADAVAIRFKCKLSDLNEKLFSFNWTAQEEDLSLLSDLTENDSQIPVSVLDDRAIAVSHI
jgi:hypothetical protein